MTLEEVISEIEHSVRLGVPTWTSPEAITNALHMLKEYKQLKAENTRVSGWIPCSERMPEHGEEVLFAVAVPWEKGKKQRVTFGRRYDKNGKRWWSVYYCTFSDNEVTHWMPLPDPPETEDKT